MFPCFRVFSITFISIFLHHPTLHSLLPVSAIHVVLAFSSSSLQVLSLPTTPLTPLVLSCLPHHPSRVSLRQHKTRGTPGGDVHNHENSSLPPRSLLPFITSLSLFLPLRLSSSSFSSLFSLSLSLSFSFLFLFSFLFSRVISCSFYSCRYCYCLSSYSIFYLRFFYFRCSYFSSSQACSSFFTFVSFLILFVDLVSFPLVTSRFLCSL